MTRILKPHPEDKDLVLAYDIHVEWQEVSRWLTDKGHELGELARTEELQTVAVTHNKETGNFTFHSLVTVDTEPQQLN